MATKKSSTKKPAAKKTAPKKPSSKKSAPQPLRKSNISVATGHPIKAEQTMLNSGECPSCTMGVSVDLSAFSADSLAWPKAKVTWDPVSKVLKVTG